MKWTDESGHSYQEITCDSCKNIYLQRHDRLRPCPICVRAKHRELPDRSDPAILRSYNTYYAMLTRCTNSNHRDFPRYGGRGICVQPEWIESFQAFLDDMGVRPEGYTLDRINYNGHYCKENCRWASPGIQSKNKRHLWESKWSKVFLPRAAGQDTGLFKKKPTD